MNGFCEIINCRARADARGWCVKHYMRWKRHGDPLKTKINMEPVTWDYMLSCCITNNETGCIEWQKGRSSGYGIIVFNGKRDRTHRVSYIINIGKIPEGLYVCHSCDNKRCINPKHLFLGTHLDNMADKINKGRHCRGETCNLSKLTECDVIKIRGMGGSQTNIAKAFGVTPSNISKIKSGETWSHI